MPNQEILGREIEESRINFYEHQNPRLLSLDLMSEIRKREGMFYTAQARYLPTTIAQRDKGVGIDLIVFRESDFRDSTLWLNDDVEDFDRVECDLVSNVEPSKFKTAKPISNRIGEGYPHAVKVLTRGYSGYKGTHNANGKLVQIATVREYTLEEIVPSGNERYTGFYLRQHDGRLGWHWLKVNGAGKIFSFPEEVLGLPKSKSRIPEAHL